MSIKPGEGLGTPDWIRCDNCRVQLPEVSEKIKALEVRDKALSERLEWATMDAVKERQRAEKAEANIAELQKQNLHLETAWQMALDRVDSADALAASYREALVQAAIPLEVLAMLHPEDGFLSEAASKEIKNAVKCIRACLSTSTPSLSRREKERRVLGEVDACVNGWRQGASVDVRGLIEAKENLDALRDLDTKNGG